jgi:CheY-like chemotaxis protein
MRDVLFFRDMDLNLKFVSPSVERVFGYSVEVFDSAETAVSVYTRRWTDIDLVILDLVLPGMNGTQAMDVIRSVNPDAPVLLVSGYTADDEIRERLRDGRTEFLEKPFLLADLAQALARLMG